MKTKIKILLSAVIALVLAILVIGCSGQNGGQPKPEANKSSQETTTQTSGISKSSTNESDTPGEASETSIASIPYYKDTVAELNKKYTHQERDQKNAEKHKARQYKDGFGNLVQPVPDDEIGWNFSYLNADQRGCTSCHTLEDALLNMDTYHGQIYNGYPTEQTYANCVACHAWAQPLKNPIHGIHNMNKAFQAQGGSCDSCHYIDAGENGPEFKRWDYEKFNLYKGITDVSSEDAKLQITYDQDTKSTTDQIFYKSLKSYGGWEPTNWRTDDSKVDEDLYNNWVFSIKDGVENPIEMTIPELVEKFGTQTETMKMHCCINGVGNATIFQAEVSGIPLKKVLDYAKIKEGMDAANITAEDSYPNVNAKYHIPFEYLLKDDVLLVTELNGEKLPNSQGAPLALWIPRISSGSMIKVLTGLDMIKADEHKDSSSAAFFGDFTDPAIDDSASKPNSAVLNYPSGVILTDDKASNVHLEGFADGWDEPITKVEFSLDHGKTWTAIDVSNNDPKKWTYWKLDFKPENKGSYLLNIRTTSQKSDGTLRTSIWDTQFIFHVK